MGVSGAGADTGAGAVRGEFEGLQAGQLGPPVVQVLAEGVARQLLLLPEREVRVLDGEFFEG
ncbi:hypothetical protein ASE09_23645 [Streptomyces sp. Root66D1]|nr:hypothetical protein ASE09_23645 [Streptomyces sp. Root66D1]